LFISAVKGKISIHKIFFQQLKLLTVL